jgi:hypothetical protein
MFARVSMFRGPPEQLEEGIRYARANVLPEISRLAGWKGVLGLVDWESGRAMTMTFWESEAALRASEEEAARLRNSVAAEIGSPVAGVDRYDVTFLDIRA